MINESLEPTNGSWIQEIATINHYMNGQLEQIKLNTDASNLVNAITSVVTQLEGIKQSIDNPSIVNSLNQVNDSLNQIKDNTSNINPSPEYDVIIDKSYVVPGSVTTIVTREPIKGEEKAVNIVYKENIVKGPDRVVKIKIKDAYLRTCGAFDPMHSNYVKCMRCVDKFLEENPNSSLIQITSAGTGCKFNKYAK